jgi:hypothetical protein
MKLPFFQKFNALPLLSSLVAVAISFGTVTAQRTSEKSLTIKSGDTTEIEDLNFKNLIELNEINADTNSNIKIYTSLATGKIFVTAPKEVKGSKAATIRYKMQKDGDTLTGYRIYNLNFVPSLITANDDIKDWSGSNTLVVDFLQNDIIDDGLKQILINYVPEGFTATIQDNKMHVTALGSILNASIQYTITDNAGGVDQGIVMLKPSISYSGDKTFKFVVNYSAKKMIHLPSGYQLMTYPINGQLSSLSDIFYEYAPQSYFVGKDSFMFQTIQGQRINYFVDIINAENDPGLIKDDVFYTTPNKTLDIDVLANDLLQDITITDFSYQLESLSPGKFRYGGGSTGVKNYSYNALTDVGEETGRIKINVSNYLPENLNYSVALLSNTTYAFDYDVPIAGYGFTVANAPAHGTIDFYMGETPNMECGKGFGKYMIVYKPNANFVGQDEVTLNYCIDGTNCKTVKLKFNVVENNNLACACINNCVYPGDLDGDGRVSAADILVLGRYMGAVGPKREKANNTSAWVGEQSSKWGIKNSKGNDLMHADANGDGVLNQADMDYINQNYGKVKGFVPRPPLGFKEFPFDIIAYPEVVDSGETQTLYFVLGSEDIPANAVHGMSFNLNLGPIDSSSFKFELYPDSWLTESVPSVGISKQVNKGQINIGLTIAQGASVVGEEVDGLKATGVSGYGIIAKATYVVGEEVDGLRLNAKRGNRTLSTDGVQMEDLSGESFHLDGSKAEIRVRPTEAQLSFAPIDVFTYPNPVTDRLILSAPVGKVINKAGIYDMTGRVIIEQDNNTNEVHIDLSKVDLGIYLAKINVDGEEIVKKIVKK